MTLLDRYLSAIREHLPKDLPADDVVAEIGDELQSQQEARETELGRALTEDEEAALIKAHGHPRAVAARYNRVQYLIGPELLPFYWSTLSLVAVIVVAIELIGGGVAAIFAHNGLRFFSALGAAFSSLIWIFGIVTIVFAIAERVPQSGESNFATSIMRWDPRKLPTPGARAPVSRFSSLAEFIANTLMLLVLLDANGPQHIPLDGVVTSLLSAVNATLTPAWHAALIGTIIGTALLAVAAITVFIRPQLVVLHECARMVASIAVIIGVVITLQAGPWITPVGAVNTSALYGLVAALVILGIQLFSSLRVLVSRR